MASYSSQRTTAAQLLREASLLYDAHRKHIPETVQRVLTELRRLDTVLAERYNFKLKGRDVLDIGVGQFLPQMHYFALHNRVTGIDFDIIAQGFEPLQYLRMFGVNGPRRTAKTLVRKLLGVDRFYLSELKANLGVRMLPKRRVLRMDACNLSFPEASFDFVHCFSVFHSLPDPAAAAEGIKRVLRPGGVVYISLHLYTCETGALDPRAFTDANSEVAFWRHLRPKFAHEVHPNAYLNKLRLTEWRDLFAKHMPGADLHLTSSRRPGIEAELEKLRANGELAEFSDEELLTHRVEVFWQKPGSN